MSVGALSQKRFALLAGAAALLSACSSAKVVSDLDVASASSPRPTVIYVAEFDLPEGAIKSESLLARLPLHQWREQSQAQSLARSLEAEIVQDLTKKGLPARPLSRDDTLPNQGWLVRGAIVQLDEGNRVRRAVIGFGSGQTDMQVAVSVANLTADHAPAPLYELRTGARSGKGPGAVVTMNPYSAAVKFVLSGRDLGQNTKKTAAQIADHVATHVGSAISAPPSS